jgi:NAD(P)-dependent dehydrogenase (short-subunit alcohol dehydrogenase family)
MNLKNKVAIVTGASSGIGEQTALGLAEEGAKVVLVGRNNEKLNHLKSTISESQGSAISLVVDLSKPDNCKFVADRTIEEFGSIDILINAAGILIPGDIFNTDLDGWNTTMTINLDSVFYLMKYCSDALKKTKGNIVNVSSVTGLRSFPNILSYCVSKAGLDQLTRCTALELAPYGVRVNSVNPGVVITNLHKRSGMNDEKYNDFLEHSKTTHPLGRVGRPEEIAKAILFLASENSGWTTGLTMSIDGGRQLTCSR